MKESGTLPPVEPCCGSPKAGQVTSATSLEKPYLSYECLIGLQAWSLSNSRPSETSVCEVKLTSSTARGNSTRREKRLANVSFWGQRGTMTTMERFWEISILYRTCLWQMEGRHQSRDDPICAGQHPPCKTWDLRQILLVVLLVILVA